MSVFEKITRIQEGQIGGGAVSVLGGCVVMHRPWAPSEFFILKETPRKNLPEDAKEAKAGTAKGRWDGSAPCRD